MQAGMLEQNRANSKYRLGLSVFELGSLVRRRMDFYSDAKEEMQTLRTRSGETVNLAVLRDDSVIYLNSLESGNPIKVSAPLGQRIPALRCAEGRVLLAFADGPALETVKKATARRAHAPGKSQAAMQEAGFAGVRSRGFGIDLEDSVPGICAIAAPFFGADNEVAGAIGIAGPAQRLNKRKLMSFLPLLSESTSRISRRLGANRPLPRPEAATVSL
jgi:DNA-binding IclR family transcriptional regulator